MEDRMRGWILIYLTAASRQKNSPQSTQRAQRKRKKKSNNRGHLLFLLYISFVFSAFSACSAVNSSLCPLWLAFLIALTNGLGLCPDVFCFLTGAGNPFEDIMANNRYVMADLLS